MASDRVRVPQARGPQGEDFVRGVEVSRSSPANAIDALLAGLIDYAGLYPPASLDMGRAVGNYLAYRSGRRAAILGRFIVDISRIDELRTAAGNDLGDLRLSLIVAPNVDRPRLAALLEEGIPIESVEMKPVGMSTAESLLQNIPEHIESYIEEPIDLLDCESFAPLAGSRARVKLRMGGIVPEAFPSPEGVARALDTLKRHKLAFKATAGLHHPIRSHHRLTYAADSPRGTMHGFVNLLCATALIHSDGSATEAVQIVEEQDPCAWTLSPEWLSWRSRRWTLDQLSEARKQFVSFGSCSFEEPIRDLEAMGWL